MGERPMTSLLTGSARPKSPQLVNAGGAVSDVGKNRDRPELFRLGG